MLGRRLAGGFALIAVATLVACGSPHGTGRGPERPTAAACGSVPTSSGPLAELAQLSIKAPATASVGQVVPVSATVTSRSAVPRMITTPATSALLVVQGGRVVGRALGGSAPDVPLQLTAGAAQPAQAIPTSIRLDGCGPDTGTTGLANGRFAIVAVLGYQLDSLNSAPEGGTAPPPTGSSFALVSPPASITVG
jgi:hypothetical protein